MPTRTRNPIESFGPEILATLLKGSRETVTIPTTYRRGVTLRQRLYQLRTIMQKQNHELWPIVAKAKVVLEWGTKAGLDPVEDIYNSRKVPRPVDSDVPAILTIRPHDSEFADALLKAGVEASPLSSDPLRDHDSSDILETFAPKETQR